MPITQNDIHLIACALRDLKAIGESQAVSTETLAHYLKSRDRWFPTQILFRPGSTADFAQYCKRYGSRDRRWFIPLAPMQEGLWQARPY